MISSDVIRGYNDTILLALLLHKDGYGYELSREIQTRTGGAYPIKETTLYSAINRLQKMDTSARTRAQKAWANPAPITASRTRGGPIIKKNATNGR